VQTTFGGFMSEENRQDKHPQVEGQDSAVFENARVGYQVAVNLWTFQSNLNWGRFNAMLTANSIITAVIGIVLINQSSLFILKILLPIVGLVFCILWIFLMARGRDYHRYWISQACELEEKYLSNAVSTVSGAESKDKKHKKIQYGWLSRTKIGKSQDVVIYGVILAFIIVYVAVLWQMLYLEIQSIIVRIAG
jgi:hypothetical protein